MYKVIIDDFVSIQIDNFIDSYTDTFLKRFNDTWIFDEFLIVEEYKKKSVKLNEDIYYWIQEKLSEEKVLWHKITENKELECIIFIWNYMLILWYTEESSSKNRFVESISFHRK